MPASINVWAPSSKIIYVVVFFERNPDPYMEKISIFGFVIVTNGVSMHVNVVFSSICSPKIPFNLVYILNLESLIFQD